MTCVESVGLRGGDCMSDVQHPLGLPAALLKCTFYSRPMAEHITVFNCMTLICCIRGHKYTLSAYNLTFHFALDDSDSFAECDNCNVFYLQIIQRSLHCQMQRLLSLLQWHLTLLRKQVNKLLVMLRYHSANAVPSACYCFGKFFGFVLHLMLQ